MLLIQATQNEVFLARKWSSRGYCIKYLRCRKSSWLLCLWSCCSMPESPLDEKVNTSSVQGKRKFLTCSSIKIHVQVSSIQDVPWTNRLSHVTAESTGYLSNQIWWVQYMYHYGQAQPWVLDYSCKIKQWDEDIDKLISIYNKITKLHNHKNSISEVQENVLNKASKLYCMWSWVPICSNG